MKTIVCLLVGALPSVAVAAAPGEWAHLGNTYNSAIFVDRAVLAANSSSRPFRTLHINTQPAAGWRAAEHRGTINCAAQTLRYEGVFLTKLDGRRDALPSAMTKPVPFPAKGLMRTFAMSVCAGRLGPAIKDPEGWTKKNFRPG